MAKRGKPADEFKVKGVDGSNEWPTVQEILDGWRKQANEIASRFSNEPERSVKGKIAVDARDVLKQLDIIDTVSFRPQVLLSTVALGTLFERMRLRGVEPWIGRSPRVSKANAVKAKLTALLDDGQWEKVLKYIQKRRAADARIPDVFKEVQAQLTTGTFNVLPGVLLENCDISTIRKRWNKRER